MTLSPKNQIYFCDAPRRLEVLTYFDFPASTIREIRELTVQDHHRNTRRFLFFVGTWILASVVLLETNSLILHAFAWLAMAGCLFGWLSQMHDATHGTLFRQRFWNHAVGFLCGLLMLTSVTSYRTVHMRHHQRNRSEDDPDDAEFAALRMRIPLIVFYGLLATVGAYFYIAHIGIDGLRMAQTWRRRAAIVVEYCLIGTAIAALVILLPFAVLAKLWLIPFVVACQLMHVRFLAEHTLTSRGNAFTGSRTVVSNRFLSFWICNMNYHLEHHLFPRVPWYRLPRVHALLQTEYRRAGASIYPSHLAFLRDYWRVVRHGIVPGMRLLPRASLQWLAEGSDA